MDLTPRISVLHMPAHENFIREKESSIRVINVMDMIWIVILKIR